MAVTTEKPAPYAPATAILDVIDRYRNRGLQSPITSDVLERVGVSRSLVPRSMQALRTLDLIDENGKPTEIFENIRIAPEPEYKQRLKEWLDAAYADVISFVDPATDDETKIRDAFRAYKPQGQQPRMVSLFLGLYVAAGIAPERAPKQRQPREPRQQKRQRILSATGFAGPRGRMLETANSAGIPAPLAGLLSSLPEKEKGWTAEEREKFVTTFKAVLDYCIPVVGDDAPSVNQEEEGDNET